MRGGCHVVDRQGRNLGAYAREESSDSDDEMYVYGEGWSSDDVTRAAAPRFMVDFYRCMPCRDDLHRVECAVCNKPKLGFPHDSQARAAQRRCKLGAIARGLWKCMCLLYFVCLLSTRASPLAGATMAAPAPRTRLPRRYSSGPPPITRAGGGMVVLNNRVTQNMHEIY